MRFGFRCHRVIIELVNGVSWQAAQFLDSAVTGEPGGVAHHASQPRMVRVLIFNQTRGEHDAGPDAPDEPGQLDDVSCANFKVGIATEFAELDGRAQNRRRAFCLGDSLSGRAVRGGFTP